MSLRFVPRSLKGPKGLQGITCQAIINCGSFKSLTGVSDGQTGPAQKSTEGIGGN